MAFRLICILVALAAPSLLVLLNSLSVRRWHVGFPDMVVTGMSATVVVGLVGKALAPRRSKLIAPVE